MSLCAPPRRSRVVSRPLSLGATTLSGLMVTALFGASAATAVEADVPRVHSAREAGGLTEQVPLDRSALERAVHRAEEAGIGVESIQDPPESVPADAVESARSRLSASIADQTERLETLTDRYRTERAEWERRRDAAQAAYNAAMDKYRQDRAAYESQQREYLRLRADYERLVNEQITHADPDTALTPDRLVYEQPFTISPDRNGLVRIEGIANEPGQANTYDAHNNYNSDSVTHVRPVNGSSFTAIYRHIAVDKATGRALNAELRVSDVVVSTVNPGEPLIEVFSNFSDNIALYNVTAAKQTLTYTYADDGSPYSDRYYVSFGSLNGQHTAEASRYEFAQGEYEDADHGVIATFLNPVSEIAQRSQEVYGTGGTGSPKAFMLPHGSGQSRHIDDTEPDIMRRLGVTFLAHNGSSFWVGTSGGAPGHEPEDVETITATYNHVMLSADTVAPTAQAPVAPTPPVEPERNIPDPPAPVHTTVHYPRLETPYQPTRKVAEGEGRFVLSGQTTHQSVTKATGFRPLHAFVLGDNILATEDGRIPVTVRPEAVRVTTGGSDVTNQFRVRIEEAVFQGRKVLQVRAEAASPQSLPPATEYTLHVEHTAREDGVADQETDIGFAILNEDMDYTDPHSYPEALPHPHKFAIAGDHGSPADGRATSVGERLTYLVVLDASDLDRTVAPVTRLGIFDDYDDAHGRVLADQVKVLEIPPTTDASSARELADIAASGVPEVTDQFTVTDHGPEGLSVMARSDGHGLVPKLGGRFLVDIPYEVTDNSDGEIKNSAWQVVDDVHTPTETVLNPLRARAPQKHAVADSAGHESLDGGVVALSSRFSYELESSTRPARVAADTTEWTVVDDYDESHDALAGPVTVTTRFPLSTAEGTTIEAGSDITRFFAITVDAAQGSVTVAARPDFLDLISLPANQDTEQGWVARLPMIRTAPGDVDNVMTESLDGYWLPSNTVTTHTPEPEASTPSPPANQDVAPDRTPSPLPPSRPSPPATRAAQPPVGRTAHTGAAGLPGTTPWAAGALGITTALVGTGLYKGRHRAGRHRAGCGSAGLEGAGRDGAGRHRAGDHS